ncbi:hypothetical protein LSUB1_G007924, partial [Lachnellula subtilissima]
MAEPRKIELQSPEDLQHLIAIARRAANEKIDQALPPMEGDVEDAMRKAVEKDVHNYINNVYTATFPSITLNGLTPDPEILQKTDINTQGVEEEYEPFNAKLFSRAKDLARQEEDLIEEIAALRRTVPGKVVEATKKGYREGVEADEEAVRGVEERVRGGVVKGDVVGVRALDRQGDVEAGWKEGVEGLQRVWGRCRGWWPG